MPTVVLALIPLGFVVVSAIDAGPASLWHLLVRPRGAELLGNTARLTLATIALTAIIGTAAAWVLERTNVPARHLLHPLLVAPLAVPAFVNSFGWVSLSSRIDGFDGALLVVTLSYFPFVFLPVAASLRGLDPALEDTARSLGHGSLRVFTRVVLPQLRPALLGGCLLVGLHLLAEFGALRLLGFPTFTTAIFDQYKTTFSGPAASGLATVLAFGCLLLLLAELRLRGQRRYARVGGGARREAERVPLGRATPLVLAGVLALIVLSLGVPLGSLTRWLIIGSSTAFPIGELVSAAGSTAVLGAIAAGVTTLVALPVAWASVRRARPFGTILERSTYFGSAMPGIVVALALITVTIRYANPLYQTTAMLVAAYVILFLPRAMVAQRTSIAQAAPVMEDVAASLGAGALARWWRVTLPAIAAGLGAGAALVFLAVVTELTATLLLSPIGTTTLASRFWSESSAVHYGAAAPYAALMVLISIPATILLTRRVQLRTAT